jgi:hypothetical protein
MEIFTNGLKVSFDVVDQLYDNIRSLPVSSPRESLLNRSLCLPACVGRKGSSHYSQEDGDLIRSKQHDESIWGEPTAFRPPLPALSFALVDQFARLVKLENTEQAFL